MKTTVDRSRVSLLRALVLLLIMCDTIRRMPEGTRPIDLWMLVIELLVLLLIAYEVAAGIWFKSKTKRRSAIMLQQIEQGQKLKENVPQSGITDLSISEPWIKSVNEWIQQTENVLKNYSSHAAASFNHESKSAVGQDYRFLSSLPNVRDSYRTLVLRVSNLRSIVEKPDLYF